LENQLFITGRSLRSLSSLKEKEVKKLVIRIAVDENLKYNGRKCYLFAALDVERNKFIHLKVYQKML